MWPKPMFICEACGTQCLDGEKSILVTVDSRPKRYPTRLKSKSKKNHRNIRLIYEGLDHLSDGELHHLLKEWEVVDWGGEGTEPTKQLRMCRSCALTSDKTVCA